MVKYSFVIAYSYYKDRQKLLFACVKNLLRLGTSMDIDFEICIHETGISATASDIQNLDEHKIKYLHTLSNGVFHRAWALNVGTRYLSVGKTLILLDCDIVLTSEWIKNLIDFPPNNFAIGWNQIYYLTPQYTNTYVDTLKLVLPCEYSKVLNPHKYNAAGGVVIVPRDTYYKCHGIPEDFYGTWGGSDNAFIYKLLAFGESLSPFTAAIYHLWHTKNIKVSTNITDKTKQLKRFSFAEWEQHHENLSYAWGDRHNTLFISEFDKNKLDSNIWHYSISGAMPQAVKYMKGKMHPNRWRTKEERARLHTHTPNKRIIPATTKR